MTGWAETRGRKPKTGERLLNVRYRNGLESKHAYTAKQLRWDHTPHNDPWDITHVRRAPE
jgi:hypothetical protein